MANSITLFNLLHFMPLNEKEKELYNFDKNIINRFMTHLDKGIFYLGGHLRMNYNDIINLDLLQKIRVLNEQRILRLREYGEPTDSTRAYTEQKEIEFIENMIKTYIRIMALRENI